MKKLLLGATLILGSLFAAKAQITIMSEPFGGPTKPAGWAINTPAVPADSFHFNNTYGSNMLTQAGVPVQGYCAFVDDWDYNPNQTTANYDSLKSPSMNCSSYTHVFISLNFMFWLDDGHETGSIAVSTNGGISWTTAINLPNTGGGWENGAIFDISTYAAGKPNVMIAFTYFDGVQAGNQYVAVGMCIQNVTVYSPANYDVQVLSQTRASLMQVGTPYPFSGVAANLGADGITNMNMNYSVNNGTPQTQPIASIAGFNSLTTYNWSMPSVPFTPPSAGIYTVKYWADNLNGNPNVNTDTLVATFWAIDSVKTREAVYEEYTGQSCVFCMIAAPNVDSVYENNTYNSNIIRYHVPIPNRDYMYDANTGPVVARENYYAVQGAPDGFLDGTYLYPSTYQVPDPAQRYSSTTVQNDDALGSPFKIEITSAQYIASRDSFYVSANITAYAAFNQGLTAQVALTIDSITYQYDLSYDDPQQEFAPPIGTGAAGSSYQDAPDYYYDYTLKFTHVCEEMFPNSGAGTSLAAFTPGQTQSVHFGWKKNHPWGALDRRAAYRDSEYYDSSSTGQFVVFVQSNNAIASYGVPAKYIFQSASAPVSGITALGVQKLSDAVSFQMYPNPTSNNTTLAFSLTQDQNVDVEVYNMLGDVVYSANQGMLSSGQHTVMINGSSLSNGVYMVRIITNGAATTQKLVIQK